MRKFGALGSIYRQIMKGPLQNAMDLKWVVNQKLRKMALKAKTSTELDALRFNLGKKNYTDGSVIVITFGSRWFGNPDNELSDFMETYLATTRVPSRAELLIKIDDDDDLTYFAEIKEKYGQHVKL